MLLHSFLHSIFQFFVAACCRSHRCCHRCDCCCFCFSCTVNLWQMIHWLLLPSRYSMYNSFVLLNVFCYCCRELLRCFAYLLSSVWFLWNCVFAVVFVFGYCCCLMPLPLPLPPSPLLLSIVFIIIVVAAAALAGAAD